MEADAESRHEIAGVQQDLQSERSELNEQWNALETERQVIAPQQSTETIIVPVAQAIGVTLLAAIVVGFCWTLVFGLRRHDDSDAQLVELLVRDVVSDQPIFLPNLSDRPTIAHGQESSGDNLLMRDV